MKNHTMEFIIAGRRQRHHRWLVVTVSLAVLAVALCGAMLLLGNTIYPLSDVIRTLFGAEIQGVSFAVHTIRLPRMLAGFFAGIAFGIAGNIFQTMLRNPLANPNVIGISTGSSAAAVFCIVILHTSEMIVSMASVVAGLATVLFIYLFSKSRTFSIGRIILVGIGMQAMLNALISYFLLISAQQDIPSALRWLTGSLNGVQLHELPLLMISVLIFVPIMVVLGKQLNVLELGEQAATSLGIRTTRTRLLLIVSAVLILALATAITGPIAFVAFLAGPIAKRLVGTGFSTIIPAGLVGANLVLASDLIGQFAFDVRYPVGIITGIIGAPYLICLLIRMNQKGEL
ncbi:putative siderophore transport system permease protein YfhA [Paraliobacillus ryukyuensis]|uniref:Iron complex transport system permease protein n=1 Tax=Paraliobacillus ryukyuensis TaxID=200904 RepID=A0A366ECW5_9BACI|nr:iron chelate uptake ABC transporter family permease subunit [Paraliobacillus ryukyuensis]RBP00244.1 iron complex transport system permease protein [Paraliobacillus ryukyuensis]